MTGSLLRRLTRGRKLTRELCDWYTLELLCEDVGLIHAHFGTDGLYYSPLIEAADVPMLVTFHGHDAYRFPNRFGGWGATLLRRLFDKATMIHAVSDHMRHSLLELGCPPDKIHTLRVGIELDRFQFQPPSPGNRTRVTCVAAFREKKGLRYLIEAFRRAYSERRDLELFLVGDGPLRSDLERRIVEAGLDGVVTLTGHIPLDEVARVLADTHIYVQPSVTAADGDQEGVPATLMEAMARGLPAIATIHSGIPELVREGITGYLVEERDIEALTERILTLADAPALWKPMGEAGRERIERLHDVRRQTRFIEDSYAELLAGDDIAAKYAIGRVDAIAA